MIMKMAIVSNQPCPGASAKMMSLPGSNPCFLTSLLLQTKKSFKFHVYNVTGIFEMGSLKFSSSDFCYLIWEGGEMFKD